MTKTAIHSAAKRESRKLLVELGDHALDAVAGGDAVLSGVSRTRAEISLTFVRNVRA